MNNNRIIEIESKVAYLEDTINQLNNVIYQQQKQITQLENTCKLLVNKIRIITEHPNLDPDIDQVPPHY